MTNKNSSRLFNQDEEIRKKINNQLNSVSKLLLHILIYMIYLLLFIEFIGLIFYLTIVLIIVD